MLFRSVSRYEHPGHSATSAVNIFVNDIVCATEKKLHCVILFIDLSKDFDKLEHDLLKTAFYWF